MRTLKLTFPLLLLLIGCHGDPTSASPAVSAASPAKLDMARQQLALIPPPSKSRYTAVPSIASWQNPYITVYPNMLTLHVLLADANSSDLGVGGITRPVGARRRDLSIAPADLAEAVSAVPVQAWPYGRVIALEEAHDTPAKDRPQTRRTLEVTMQQLSNLGVVMYDWNESGTHGLTE